MSSELKDHYIIKDGKKLQYGYTTGSCAAAAAKAAALMLFAGEDITEVRLITPMGISLLLPVLKVRKKSGQVSCAIQKYAGDDPDVTDGVLVYATVTRGEETEVPQVCIDGGKGVGRVTRKGLDQPAGNAAINRVPREMIEKEVLEVLHQSGNSCMADVLIEVPAGEELAAKTFNPRLGITGGISILGTTGIVVPMSEEALVKSIETEMRMHIEAGEKELLITPGNYGADFVKEHTGLDFTKNIQCSNYVGKTIDLAVNMGAKKLTFVAHIGKFIKVAAGIMDTHSRSADGRAESMAACAIRAGASLEAAREILDSVTTEESIQILKREGILKETMEIAVTKVHDYLCRRAGELLGIDVILFSSVEGELASYKERKEI